MGIRVGIDLGTTFSAIAWVNPRTNQPELIKSDTESDQLITPSEIWFAPDQKIYCGARAKEAFETGEEGVANTFKRYMGTDEVCFIAPDGKQYRSEELSTILLRHMKAQAEKNSGQTIEEAVITVPAYFEDEPRAATRRAAQAAGLQVRDIISEPTAAALNYGLEHWRKNALIMVYDLGGGTFDVTLVAMTDNTTLKTLGTTGDHRRGGRDWDEALAGLVLDKLENELGMSLSEEQDLINDLRSQAEEWKKQLSRLENLHLRIRVPGSGFVSITLSRKEFDDTTAPLLNQTASLCNHLLSSLHIRWDQITDVLLVGGSTRMPQVRAFLTECRNGKEPIMHVNPDYAVALGAAMRAGMHQREEVVNLTSAGSAAEAVEKRNAELLQTLNRDVQASRTVELADIRFQDAVAHAMGIVLVNPEQTGYINSTIIPANAPVPCKYSQSARFDSWEREMEIYVLQGEGSIADAHVNAKYVASGFTRVPGRFCVVHVQYSYDSNHLIHVQVRQDDGQADLPLRKEPFTQEDIAKFLGPYQPPEPGSVSVPMTIVLVIDVSGSMSGTPIQNAKKAMEDFTHKFPDQDVSFGVLLVSDRCRWVIHPSQDLRAVRTAIGSISVGDTGYGNSAHPFTEILSELGKGESMPKYAIVMADGVWSYQDAAIQAAKKCHANGIDIIGMGFGSADKRFMQAISSVDAVMTTDSQLGASFGRIAQSLSGRTAPSESTKKKGFLNLFSRKEESRELVARSWETPME